MKHKPVSEVITARGHPNIQAIHPTTLMFTKDRHLSRNGDCVIAVAADKALADLGAEFKEQLRNPTAKITINIEVEDLKDEIRAVGSPKLCLCHTTDVVIRKSDYTCTRTLAIHADKASSDLSRELVEKLKNPKNLAKISITVTSDC